MLIGLEQLRNEAVLAAWLIGCLQSYEAFSQNGFLVLLPLMLLLLLRCYCCFWHCCCRCYYPCFYLLQQHLYQQLVSRSWLSFPLALLITVPLAHG